MDDSSYSFTQTSAFIRYDSISIEDTTTSTYPSPPTLRLTQAFDFEVAALYYKRRINLQSFPLLNSWQVPGEIIIHTATTPIFLPEEIKEGKNYIQCQGHRDGLTMDKVI